MLPAAAWKATLGQLEQQMTAATFATWLKDAELKSYADNEYVVAVQNAYARDWLEKRLDESIRRTLSTIVQTPIRIRYVVNKDDLVKQQAHSNVSPPAQENSHGNWRAAHHHKLPETGSNGHNGAARRRHQTVTLNPKYTFGSYVVGSGNRLAHAAARSVAESPGQTYNPLFIYGGVGLGKTHLLHAIGHQCRANGYEICYVTSETFANDMIQSIRSQSMSTFRQKYRTPDVLLIDDIQFIAGKESTQEEMFHTFNDLHRLGKQVILSSDRPPKAMATLEERLKSRFEWGLMADIQLPDTETRMAILRTKADLSAVFVPDDILVLIANRFQNNVRELEGALTKVIAYSQITGAPIDQKLLGAALSDMVNKTNKITVNQVISAVCSFYGVSEAAIVGANRSRTVAFPRQVCMYLARTETDASLPQIGAKLGNRDHTTVLYGYSKISNVLESNATLRRDTLAIKSSLYEGASV